MGIKILGTADWHIGTFRSPVKDGLNLRTEDTKRCLNELLKVAKEERPHYSLISGDLFHVGRLLSDRCCEEIITAIHYIKELATISKQVVVMRGTPNHDGLGQFNVLSEMFADYSNVHIITTPQILSFDDIDIVALPGFDKGIYRAKFPGLSKEKENEIFTQELSNIILGLKMQCRLDKNNILMAHYTIPGCNTESGQTMMLTKFEPILTREALVAADYDLVVLGHIHRPQMVEGYKNIYYQGAISQLNFGDENQERGCFIYEIEQKGIVTSKFHKFPTREFITLKFTNKDITAINLGNIDDVAINYWRYNGLIQNRIVRIYYSCSAENNKALNKAVLEKTLLADGAFMVWEILPDKIEEFTNRTELSNTTDPELNFIKYLEEKQFPLEKIQKLILKARPIIAEAEASITKAANTGTFEPVEISVKNYRNYVEETFNFKDISFCTINGQNGAGKSSLFMDAIIDCLYEEPREGEKTGWIRNNEKAHSGSIMFTFRIGKKIFRVTRTRTRSGKGTLNIAEFMNGEWKDCSKEKYNDTQQEILNIIGMDGLTFKSCALIMQDQYGLFLQAKPEKRVEVLGTLLGLGVYQIMEKISQDKAKIFGVKNKELKQEVEIHNNMIASFGNPDEELTACTMELAEYENNLKIKIAERDKNKLLLTHQQEAIERRTKLLTTIADLQVKKNMTEQNKATQQTIINNNSVILENRSEIEAKVAEYNCLVEKERTLASKSILYSSKKNEAENLRKQEETEQVSIDSMKVEVFQKNMELERLQPKDQDGVIRENAAEYERQKKLLNEAYEKERAYRAVEQELTQAKNMLQQIVFQYESDVKSMRLSEEGFRKKAELLLNVKCMDIENAKCGFLADAISAKHLLKEYPKKYAERKKIHEEEVSPINKDITSLKKHLLEMNYDTKLVNKILTRIAELKPYVSQMEVLNQRENKIALIQLNLANLQSNILEAEKRLTVVKLKATEMEQERDKYEKAFKEYAIIQNSIQMLKPWLEKEKQLPLAEERKTTAINRVLELTVELTNINMEIAEKQAEADKEIFAISGMEKLQTIVNDLETEVNVISTMLKEKQMKIGALQQKSEQIKKLKKEIVVLQKSQTEYAKEAADYEVLKRAFSQSGVPHQIIRSIIPQLTTTANTILGQMTGGKMGVGFRLERLQKNGKEKGSLDIFIEEYGKAVLPYLSKSGGEKVKSSLSVILALAEIKSSSAGIQLGMLFIDEPPFLDGDGIQAYCDALETIQHRYNDMKIMAITHDPTMKARFPQNLDVIKTENGSKVVY